MLIGLLFSVNTTELMATSGELVENGSFEKFTVNKDHKKRKLVQFDKWNGDGEVWTNNIGKVATKGIYKADLDVSKKNLNALSQSINTVAGEKYTFSLDAYARKANTSDFELLVDGQVISTITPSKYWEKYGVEFTGKGGEQTISIREVESQNDGKGAIIDNVSVQSELSLDQLKAQERALVEIIEPTGLDQIHEVISNDRKLNAKVPAKDIAKAQEASTQMNKLIKEAIKVNALANDGVISIADTLEINRYLVKNYSDKWSKLREDFALIEKKARVTALNRNAVRNVWGKIYNLGFEAVNNNKNTTNLDGDKSSSFKTVGYYLGVVAKNDALSGELKNENFKEVEGTTGTKLDMIVNVILNDRGLLRNVPTSDLRAGAKTADEMNHLIVEAIKVEGLGNDKKLTTADIRTINNYLVANYAQKWAELHGDDEDGEETGYHRVQNDGATTRLYADNVINSIADGIYHLGFKTNLKNRLVNEDGNKNASFKRVASWLTQLLSDDLNNQKEDLKILIPLYSYPDLNQNNSIWQKLIDTKKANPNIEIVAIVNPSNGHFREKNSDYTRGIQDLIKANIKVVGYVYTKYGKRDTQDVIDDIEAWKEFYKDEGVSGIFFDETSTNANLLSHYSNLSTQAKERGLEYIILNPGITTDQSYVDSGIADLIVTYENPNNELLSNPPATYNTPTKTTELSLLIYEMEDDNVDDLISFAREHKFSYIYFTEDGSDGNPWDSISQYFDDEVAKALN